MTDSQQLNTAPEPTPTAAAISSSDTSSSVHITPVGGVSVFYVRQHDAL